MMSPQEFVAMQGIPARVSRPRRTIPAVTATCAPEVASFIDPASTLQDAGLLTVKAWAPLPGFGPFIVPDLRRFYFEERGPMNDRESGPNLRKCHAMRALERARNRIYELQQSFPDAIEDPVKLARFARAQRLTGPKLAAMMPPWVKTWIRNHSAPEPFVFIPNQPPKYPAWTYYRMPGR